MRTNIDELEKSLHIEYVNKMMGAILTPSELDLWWEIPINRLQGRSPQELIEEHPELLLGYVVGYSIFFPQDEV